MSHTLLMLDDSPIADDSAAPRFAAENDDRNSTLSRHRQKLITLVAVAARMQNQ